MTGIATDTSRRSSRDAWLAVGVILMASACALLLITQRLRKELRVTIIQQDGIALGAALLVSPSLQELPEEIANDSEILFAKMAEKILEAARHKKEIFGARVFNQTGALQLSIGGGAGDLAPEQLAQLQAGKPINWFEPHARLGNHNSDAKAPLIHTIVPLEQAGRFIGAAEFITDGQEVMVALRKLDRDLWVYSGLILFMMGGVTIGAMIWAFRRLEARTSPCKNDDFEAPGSLCGSGT